MQVVDSLSQSGGDLSSIDFRKALNAEQYAAVSAGEGPSLILAGAGSGKTRTLTYRVAWLLKEGIKPWEILLLTFTNKAAKEMLHRVEGLTSIPAHKFWGGTFHFIGQRILRTHGESIGIEKNFNILDANDAESLLSEVIRERDPAYLKNKDNPKAKLIADVISYARNTCTDVFEGVAKKYPYFKQALRSIDLFSKDYQTRKREQQLLDYDDLLELWLKLLEENTAVATQYQERFKNILVDEYQDTNRLQASIIDKLAANHQIMAVGDDAQCIYTWRGANFENIMTFPERHPGTVIHKIVTNYRSTPEILNFANEIMKHQLPEEGYQKELKAVRDSKCKPWFVPTMDTRQQAQFICKRIQGLCREGYRSADIAILYRAHFHAMDLQMELSRLGIAFQITSGVRFFEQAHIKDLVAQLRFICNPLDSGAFYRFACLLPKVGPRTAERLLKLANEIATKDGKTIFQVLDNDIVQKKVPAVAQEDWVDLVYSLQDLNENKDTFSPSKAISFLIEGWYGDYLRHIYPTNWQSRQDDLESLVGFASRFSSMTELLAQLVLLSSETSDRSMGINEDCIRLTTIHQAKGLEFSIVFIIGLSENLFPNKRSVEQGDLDEERRLFYVAATRAKDELYLVHPKVTYQGGPPSLLKPSCFMMDVSQESYKILSLPMRH